jgi:hypothetical protein
MGLLTVMLVSYFCLFLVFAFTQRETIYRNYKDTKERFWNSSDFQDPKQFF